MKKIILIALFLCAACADTSATTAPSVHGSGVIYDPKAPPIEASAFVYDASAPMVKASAFRYE